MSLFNSFYRKASLLGKHEVTWKVVCIECGKGGYGIGNDNLIWDPKPDGTKLYCTNCKKRFIDWKMCMK